MAIYPKAVKKLIPPGPNDPRIRPRLAIVHVDAGNAASLYGYFNGPSGGIESHFHILKSGVVEQYRDTDFEADANSRANPFAVSIETQGYASGEWTPEQLAALKDLLLWLHETHPIPLAVPSRWDGAGVGYHILFMDEWAGGPRACPGPDRIKQFHSDLVPWMKTGGAPPRLSEEDELMALTVKNPKTGEEWPIDKAIWSDWSYSIDAARDAAATLAIVKAMAAKNGLTEDEIEAAARAGAAAALEERIKSADVLLNIQE